jgi:hypothetical protein
MVPSDIIDLSQSRVLKGSVFRRCLVLVNIRFIRFLIDLFLGGTSVTTDAARSDGSVSADGEDGDGDGDDTSMDMI